MLEIAPELLSIPIELLCDGLETLELGSFMLDLHLNARCLSTDGPTTIHLCSRRLITTAYKLLDSAICFHNLVHPTVATIATSATIGCDC